MSHKICHYCLQISDSFSLQGKYKTNNEKFLCYRLCNLCNQKLIGINSYSDKQGRQTFLTTVKANAKNYPEYA